MGETTLYSHLNNSATSSPNEVFISVEALARQGALFNGPEAIGTLGKKTTALIAIVHRALFNQATYDNVNVREQLSQGDKRVISPTHYDEVIAAMACLNTSVLDPNILEPNPAFEVVGNPKTELLRYKVSEANIHAYRLTSVETFGQYYKDFVDFIKKGVEKWNSKPALNLYCERFVNALHAGYLRYNSFNGTIGSEHETEIWQAIEAYLIEKGEDPEEYTGNELEIFSINLRDSIRPCKDLMRGTTDTQDLITLINSNLSGETPPASLQEAEVCKSCKHTEYCPLHNWTRVDKKRLVSGMVEDRAGLWLKMREAGLVYKPEEFEAKIRELSAIIPAKFYDLSEFNDN